MTLLVAAFGAAVAALGVVLLAVPAVPALGIIFSGIALVAWADAFSRIGWATLVVLLLLTLVGSLADNVAALFGARKAGASAWGVAGAAIGMFVGIPFGLLGIILGPAVGAFAFEYLRAPDLRKAGLAGVGGLVGFLLGIVAKSFFGLLLVGIGVLAYFF